MSVDWEAVDVNDIKKTAIKGIAANKKCKIL